MSKIISLVIASAFLVILSNCNQNPSYQSLIEKGLQSGVEKDSLFLGYYFGMHQEEFRKHSWELNQKGLITGFVKIEYPFNELKSEALMKFYPEFDDNKIVRIPVSVSYNSWAPWNEEYWPENLIKDLAEYYEKEFRCTFREVFIPEMQKSAFVCIEGNREVRIYRDSESSVVVDWRNLNVFNPE